MISRDSTKTKKIFHFGWSWKNCALTSACVCFPGWRVCDRTGRCWFRVEEATVEGSPNRVLLFFSADVFDGRHGLAFDHLGVVAGRLRTFLVLNIKDIVDVLLGCNETSDFSDDWKSPRNKFAIQGFS